MTDLVAEFIPGDPLTPPARELLAEMVAEITEMYPPIDGIVGVPLDPAELSPPDGIYLVGYVDGAPAAGGGLRTIGPGLGEIKRMYVRPAYRGRGLSRLLLEALESAAADRGHHTVRLDTGPDQPAALHLYTAAGYRSIGNYNANPHAAFWGEKRLG